MAISQVCRKMDIGCDVLSQARRGVAHAVCPFQSVDGASAGGAGSGLIMPECGRSRRRCTRGLGSHRVLAAVALKMH